MGLKVTNEVRRTGETIYDVREGHRLVARVTSDGFFRRYGFYGHLQRPDDSLIDQHSDFGKELLDTVAKYGNS